MSRFIFSRVQSNSYFSIERGIVGGGCIGLMLVPTCFFLFSVWLEGLFVCVALPIWRFRLRWEKRFRDVLARRWKSHVNNKLIWEYFLFLHSSEKN